MPDKLRDKMNAVFGKPKAPPRKVFENVAAMMQDRKIAEHERQLQHRDLNRDSTANRDEDMTQAQAEAAREHPAPKNAPRGAEQPKSKGDIERDAKRIYEARQQAKRDAIDRKPQRQLIEDAAERAQQQEDKALAQTMRNSDGNFMGRVQGGPRLMDNLSDRQIGALIGKVVGDKALWDATVKALREPLPEWLTIQQREGSVAVRVADIEAMQQPGKGDKAAPSLTDAEKAALKDAAERGDLAETAAAILAAGDEGRKAHPRKSAR